MPEKSITSLKQVVSTTKAEVASKPKESELENGKPKVIQQTEVATQKAKP